MSGDLVRPRLAGRGFRALPVVAAACVFAAISATSAKAAGTVGGPCPAWAIAAQAPPAPAATSKASGSKTSGANGASGTNTAGALARAQASATATVGYAPKGVAVGPTKVLVQATVSPSAGALAVIAYGRGDRLTLCSPVQHLGQAAASGPAHLLLSGLQPSTSYSFRLVAKTAAGTALGGRRAFSTLAGGHVPQGVVVGSLSLGGLTKEAARTALLKPIASPLRLSYAGAFWQVARSKVGATVDVKSALNAALTATPDAQLPSAGITVDPSRLDTYVASLDRRWSHPAQTAAVRLVGKHAVVTTAAPGLAVNTPKMTKLIRQELTTGGHAALPLAVTTTKAVAAPATLEKAVVVRLGAQTLTAYVNGKPILTTPVTTGRAALPTPVGSYTIHYRASPYTFISPWPPGSPYYYPPAHVTWAMYFFDNDFLHDDPAEPTSAFGAGSEDGAYASHGCVHVPRDTMAFLYNWLPVGAPVIVSQT